MLVVYRAMSHSKSCSRLLNDGWFLDVSFLCIFLNMNVLVTVLIAVFTGSRGESWCSAHFSLFLQSRTPALRMVPPPRLILSGNTITDTSKDMPTNAPGILSSNKFDKEVAEMGVFNRALCHNCCVMASQQHLSVVHGGGTTNFCFFMAFGFLQCASSNAG